MIMTSQLKIVSFNCGGVANILPVISDLCDQNDVIVLQETWLTPLNIDLFVGLHDEFDCHSITSVDFSQPLIGRPHGGLTFLWRKSISPNCKIFTFDDQRILGLRLSGSNRELFILNVYLPYFSPDNYDDYVCYVGKISSIIECSDFTDLMVVGDFNASTNGAYFNEWNLVCEEYDLIFSDVVKLPSSSFTHVNNASLTKSWLDHCLVSRTVHNSILELNIDNNYYGSDHFPLKISIQLDRLPERVDIDSSEDQSLKINWNFGDDYKSFIFYEELYRNLVERAPLNSLCVSPSCSESEHKNVLDHVFEKFVQIVNDVGVLVYGTVNPQAQRHNVPGWNTHVRDFYESSRQAFLSWRENGSPRFGPIAVHMRQTRARFKLMLRRVRGNEKKLRAEAVARKYRSHDTVSFWKAVKTIEKTKSKLPICIDDKVGDREICSLWRDKFSSTLNSLPVDNSERELLDCLHSMESTSFEEVTPEEVCVAAGEVTGNRSPGLDGIPIEFYKNAPSFLFLWLSEFFNMLFSHFHVPTQLSDVLVVPIIKGKMVDPSCSKNYRPIAIASCTSKIFEKLIFNRIKSFLFSSDYQFGFKSGHSTETCIFALKEVIDYYDRLNSSLFICFIDIKSAFDRVNYLKLFVKLAERGVPKCYIMILFWWYKTQKLY